MIHSPRITRSQAPSRTTASEESREQTDSLPEVAGEPAATESTALRALLLEMREMRQEQARREDEIAAMLRRHDEELQALKETRPQNQQLSPSINIPCGNSGTQFLNEGENNFRATLGFKLKPDTYDGTVSLREFFSQFNLIARANSWDDATKTVALASCLRGKARSVLETVEDVSNLEFNELKSKLELRFGEGHLSQNYYVQFTNRK